MSAQILTLVSLSALTLMIIAGVPIAISLAGMALIGTYFLYGGVDLAIFTAGTAAFSVLRSYVFVTIPLFIIMGNLIACCGAASDLYTMMNRVLSRMPARLAVATVGGNAIFAAISGVSVAAAATFSRVAYPEMRRYNYDRQLALGVVAGSAMLGMLIPPSVLMIVWGILTQTSIGDLFLAGVLPGLLLAFLFAAHLVMRAARRPELTPVVPVNVGPESKLTPSVITSSLGMIALILTVTGGIWRGICTPTEAAGVGAIGGLVLALFKGLPARGIADAIVTAGKTTAPIMLMILSASLYSQFLVSSGVLDVMIASIKSANLGYWGIIRAITIVWLLLGMVLDSTSIILLTVPIFAPLAASIDVNPIVFAVYGILVIEAGLLTPPFGLLVFVVKASVDEDVSLSDVFRGSIPYCLLILVIALLVLLFPPLATWLPTGS